MKIGSLCSGYGGLDLAVEATWPSAQTAWFSEFASAPSRVFEHHWPSAPNLGDLTVIDWSEVEPVDILTAGYPCQPFSIAGSRKGEEDDRHIWPYVAEAISALRPRVVVLENVAGHLSLGGTAVVAELAERGYDARWVVVRASDVGACHRRARWFCVAYPHSTRPQGRGGHDVAPRESETPAYDRRTIADAEGERRAGTGHSRQRRSGLAYDGDDPAADADGTPGGRAGAAGEAIRGLGTEQRPGRCNSVDWGPFAAAIDRHARAVGRPAPSPVTTKSQLSPLFVEWMMMLPEGWVTDVLTQRGAALKCLGNGVVPPQAALALRLLTEVG